MSVDVEECVKTFMSAVNQLVGTSFEGTKDLRIALIEEEFTELLEAIRWGDPVQIAKEIADLVYVVVGTSVAFKIPFNEVFGAVCESNLSKLDEHGNVIKRADGKILKSSNYKPAEPVIKEILISKGVQV